MAVNHTCSDHVVTCVVDDELKAILKIANVEVVVMHSCGSHWSMLLAHPDEDEPIHAGVNGEVLHDLRRSRILIPCC